MVRVTMNEQSMHRMFERVILRHLHPLLEWLLSALSSAISFKQMENSFGIQKMFPIVTQVFVGHLESRVGREIKIFSQVRRLLVNRNKCGIWKDSNQLLCSKIIPRFSFLKHTFRSCRQHKQIIDKLH